MKSIPFIFLLIGLTFLSQAQNYYVATTGSNNNNGSLNAPWKTIQKAVSNVAPGSTINVRSGTYNEKVDFTKSGNAASGFITVQNYNGEHVIVDATGVSGNGDNVFNIYNKNYLRIKGVEIQNASVPNNHDGAGVFIEGNADHIEILNCKIHDITGDNAMGITVYGSHKTKPVQNLIIDGNEIYDCEPAHSEALTLNGNVRLFQITNNKVHDVNNIGIDMIGGEGTCPKAANDNARNGICTGNEVYNARAVYGGGYAAGIYVDGGDSIIIERNIVHDCDLGIEIGCENKGKKATNNIIRDNIMYNNDKRGLSFGGYDYPATGKVQYCEFYNNTCYKNDVLHDGAGELYIEYAVDCKVKNNLFYCGSQNLLMNCLQGNNDGNTFNYNLFYSDQAGNNQFQYDGASYNSFSSYKNATGQDANSIFANPLLTNPSAKDFHLTASSPCRDAGDPSFVPAAGELDFYGGLRYLGNRIDIGADEFDPNGRYVLSKQETFDVSVYPTIVMDRVHVSFVLDQQKTVTITMTNISGEVVSLLLNEELPEGNHQLEFGVNDLHPGIYMIHLLAGEREVTKRVVVSR